MSNRIDFIRSGLALFLAAGTMTGCGNVGTVFHAAPPAGADITDAKRASTVMIERDALRVRSDTQRHRLWVLTLNEVRVYDTSRTKQLLRKIELPNWSVSGFRGVCMPGLTLDHAGAAYVSSNAQARMLHIDADHFELTDFAITFRGYSQRDTGFGALAFAADGSLYARTTPDGVLWKIDISKANAIMADNGVRLPRDECTIETPIVNINRSAQQ